MDDQIDLLEMSDEDFLKLEMPEDAPAPEVEPEEEEQEPDATPAEEPAEEEPEEEDPEDPEQPAEDGDGKEEPEGDAEPEKDPEPKEGDEPAKDPAKEDPAPKDGEPSKEEVQTALAFYKGITAPFKANGRTMKVESVEDAIQLMQMGANYNKKMAGLKPGLRVLKMLENNQLLDEQKLSYLIDLDKKNPSAIRKLIQESGVDPLELSDDKDAKEYTPSSHSVDDRELELDQVVESIRDTPTYEQTLTTVNGWDEASKRVLFDKPQTVALLNQHMQNGIYEKVADAVAAQRALGKLVGFSDIQAYVHVGNQLAAAGAFGKPEETPPAPQPQPQPTPVEKPAEPAPDPRVKEKKRAASSTRSKPGATRPADFNPLNLSDEEFAQAMNTKLL